MLGPGGGYLLVQLLGDFDEPSAIDLAIPLELPQLTAQIQEGTDDIFNLLFAEASEKGGVTGIAIVEESEAAGGFGILFVVEAIDEFQVPIKGVKVFCGAESMPRPTAVGWKMVTDLPDLPPFHADAVPRPT